jgi:hypothetical protein
MFIKDPVSRALGALTLAEPSNRGCNARLVGQGVAVMGAVLGWLGPVRRLVRYLVTPDDPQESLDYQGVQVRP